LHTSSTTLGLVCVPKKGVERLALAISSIVENTGRPRTFPSLESILMKKVPGVMQSYFIRVILPGALAGFAKEHPELLPPIKRTKKARS